MVDATRRGRFGALAVATVLLLSAAQVVLAQTDPEDALQQVQQQAQKAVQPAADAPAGAPERSAPAASQEAAPPQVPSQPAEDGDTGAHETENPAPPDHASGAVADVDLVGEDLVEVGSTRSQISDDGRASGDVTVLAIGGEEIVGAHSDSRSGPRDDDVAPFDQLCEGSGGDVCLGLLFASTSSRENAESSSARSQAALAFACLGGEQTSSRQACEGPVGAGVSTSDSRIQRDHGSGRTRARQTTSLADACVGPEGEVGGTCSGVGVELMTSESRSDSGDGTGPGSSQRKSWLAKVDVEGNPAVSITEPGALEVPPGCPAGRSLVCLYVNQGETFVFTGGGGSRQEVVHITALRKAVDGADLVLGHLGSAETLARNIAAPGAEGPFGPPDGGPGPPNPLAGGLPGPESEPANPAPGDELAFTGGLNVAGLVAVALVLLAGGLQLLAWDRRRTAAA
jgi:hypothetical protein